VTECKADHGNRGDDPDIDKSNICVVTRLLVGHPTAVNDSVFVATAKNPDQFWGPPRLYSVGAAR
jgi:hypothetical protein